MVRHTGGVIMASLCLLSSPYSSMPLCRISFTVPGDLRLLVQRSIS